MAFFLQETDALHSLESDCSAALGEAIFLPNALPLLPILLMFLGMYQTLVYIKLVSLSWPQKQWHPYIYVYVCEKEDNFICPLMVQRSKVMFCGVEERMDQMCL